MPAKASVSAASGCPGGHYRLTRRRSDVSRDWGCRLRLSRLTSLLRGVVAGFPDIGLGWRPIPVAGAAGRRCGYGTVGTSCAAEGALDACGATVPGDVCNASAASVVRVSADCDGGGCGHRGRAAMGFGDAGGVGVDAGPLARDRDRGGRAAGAHRAAAQVQYGSRGEPCARHERADMGGGVPRPCVARGGRVGGDGPVRGVESGPRGVGGAGFGLSVLECDVGGAGAGWMSGGWVATYVAPTRCFVM